MYGKWLYKEIGTEYGACKVEIYRKNYTGESIEIGALAANSLTIALENLGSITDPIGKSVCSFSIIDTDQVEYDDFFTPDATALKVVVSTRVGSGAFVTRWSGYVTPDFFAENLSYRTPISISARDNIGYLNDVDFDLTATTITVREFIQSAFRRIAEDYPMSLSFVTQKQTAEGILAIDATISTTLLKEMSWGEALETTLHDLGLQMRWVDNNTIAVLDLSQIPEYYQTQGFNFIEASGYREIVPAWRQLTQEQSYGVRENFYEGQIDQEAKLEYVTTSQISTNILLYQPIALTQWRREGAIYLLNFFNGYNFDVDDNKAESLYITGVNNNVTITHVLATKLVYSQRVTQVDKQMKFTFNLNDTLREPRATSYNRGEADSIFYLPYSQQSGATTAPIPRPYQLKFRFNVFLRAEDGSEYVMREEWVDANTVTTEQPFIEFKTKKLEVYNSGVNDAQGNPRFKYTSYDNEEEFSITIGSIPKAGTLEFIVYPYTFVDDEYASVRDDATFQRGAKISNITFAIKDTATGIESNTLVDAQHNVKNAVSYSFGEVPLKNGDFLLYAGGLFNPVSLTALKGYQRNANATNYNLLELVGRELIHFNKRNYTRLSGTIRNLNKEPLMFNRLFVREGKKYAPYNYSLNVISNEMNITSMQEVEQYETATFNTIDSQITTGGGTVSGGNNTILQYSEEAGNEKRLYELQTATEQEKNDAYVLVDKAGFPEARKVHISELGGFDVSELEQYLESNGYATLKRIWEVDSANAVVRTTYNVVSTQEVISGRRASGASSDVTGGGGISQVTVQMIVDALGYVPYSSQNPSGYITSAALNGYATQAWVEGKKYLTAIPSEYITETELSNTLGGYQTKITSSNKLAYSLISGTPTLATVATSGKYSDLSGVPTSLPASDVYAWAKAATKPTYTASEVGALSTSGGTIKGTAEGYTQHVIKINTDNTILSGIQVQMGGVVKAGVGYSNNTGLSGYRIGAFLFNATAASSIGIKDDGTPYYNYNTLIHSGNYSSYALPLSGGTISGNIVWSKGKWGVDLSARGVFMSWNDSNYLHITHDGAFYNWNTLIHSGNIGSYNAGSATKLQTARTIWGQSFDGSGNVSGNLSLFNYAISWLNDSSNYSIQIKDDGHAYYKAYYGHHFYTVGVERMRITNNGNALIGTETDNGNKLQVNGRITANSIKLGNYTLEKASYGMTLSGEYAGLTLKGTNAYNTGVNFADVDGVERWMLSYRGVNGGANKDLYIYRTTDDNVADTVMRLYRASGNVAIGGTTDNGAKLQVDGNLTATGEVISSRRASSSDARLKDNINRLIAEDCLAMVRNLQPSSWDWKNDGKHSLGFIAQDVEQYMPYAVTRTKDDKLGEKLNLQYDQFIALAIGGVQAVDNEVQQLKKEVVELKKRLSKYETVWQ